MLVSSHARPGPVAAEPFEAVELVLTPLWEHAGVPDTPAEERGPPGGRQWREVVVRDDAETQLGAQALALVAGLLRPCDGGMIGA